MIESELLSIRIILVKVTLKIGREQYLDSWTQKINDLNGEKKIEKNYKKRIAVE